LDIYTEKSQERNKWVKYYGKIKDSNLLLCDSLISKSFKISFCLYQADFEEDEEEVQLPDSHYRRRHRIVRISHQYEQECISIIFNEEESFDNITGFLKDKSQEVNKTSMMDINCSNRYPFGKLFLEIRDIEELYTQRDLQIDIEFSPYKLKSKIFECMRNTPVKFNQRFYIPIHNRFNILKVKVIRFTKEGIFSTNKKSAVVKSYEYAIYFLRVSIKYFLI